MQSPRQVSGDSIAPLFVFNTALILVAPSQSLKNITLRPFRKLVRPAVPSDIPGDQYFEYVTVNSIFILFLQILLTGVVIK